MIATILFLNYPWTLVLQDLNGIPGLGIGIGSGKR